MGLSALLTTTMPAIRDTVKTSRDEGLSVKIVAGGVARSFPSNLTLHGRMATANRSTLS